MDDETARLIFQLQLEDLQEVSSGSKGKQRAGEVSDFELALSCYRTELESSTMFVSDRHMCMSIASAVHRDGEVINDLMAQEKQAAADRGLALRSQDGIIPAPRNNDGEPQGSKSEGNDLGDELLEKMAALYIFGLGDGNDSDSEVTQPESSAWAASRSHAWKPAGGIAKRQCVSCLEMFEFYDHQLETKDSWEADYLTKALKRRMQVKFFEPPTWSPLPWMSFWEHSNLETGSKLDPLRHEWPEAGVLVLPCAEPMYLGPGQVSMWPIMDLRDDIQRGKTRFRTEYEYERVLEDTTIEVLKREYGIEAFAVPGTAGVWVESKIPPPELDSGQSGLGSDLGNMPVANRRENIRRIATIHADITDDITRWGVSIHVGQPDPVVDSWTSLTNPWTRLRQHTNTTSIVAELAHSGSSPRHASRTRQLELWSHKKTRYLQTYFDKDAPFSGTLYHSMPYSLIKVQGGRREAAPLGLDNRDLSTAWTYEFARQLGMHDGFVDHYSVVDFAEANSTDLPTKTPSSGFMSRPMLDEHWLTHPYNQVDVPSLRVGKSELVSTDIMEDTMRLEAQDGKIDHETHEGWMLSWPLWYDTLMKRLDQSIAGGAWDTRLRAHMWEKEQSARQLRRKAAVKEAEDLEQRWGVQLKQLIRRPLTDEIIRELTDKAREMERTLREVPAGAAMSKDLLESAAHMRRLLESRFPRQPQTGVEGHKLAGADTLEEVLSQ
ncbi:hypothetical protein VSDG_03139 [Cytospora chrysosperma]|uniref:Uncharacterized protein n=1 Tax=Cytospora chrysosperma TaxID=252740 RepID=A0A423W8J0_CYTCH|nr:hypothetical protein VSDG_03139 [Valsa sordida]